jgi:MFS family permease
MSYNNGENIPHSIAAAGQYHRIQNRRRYKMNTTRKIAVITGVLFIIATVVGPILATLVTPVLTGTDYLARVSAHTNQMAGGALLYLISAFAGAGIAIAMYPVMKRANAGLALGSVVFRTLEAVFYMVEVVCLLSLLTLGQQFTTAGAADRTSLQAIGNLLVSGRDQAALVAVFAFCLGAFMYYYLFFQSRLIPRWLSGFGIVAIILMMVACVLALFSGNRITSYLTLAAPIAVQEMVLAVWLIVKGFNPSAVASLSAKTATNELLSAA